MIPSLWENKQSRRRRNSDLFWILSLWFQGGKKLNKAKSELFFYNMKDVQRNIGRLLGFHIGSLSSQYGSTSD
jgi:hypothetical protein